MHDYRSPFEGHPGEEKAIVRSIPGGTLPLRRKNEGGRRLIRCAPCSRAAGWMDATWPVVGAAGGIPEERVFGVAV